MAHLSAPIAEELEPEPGAGVTKTWKLVCFCSFTNHHHPKLTTNDFEIDLEIVLAIQHRGDEHRSDGLSGIVFFSTCKR
jgi:hypothetical protein